MQARPGRYLVLLGPDYCVAQVCHPASSLQNVYHSLKFDIVLYCLPLDEESSSFTPFRVSLSTLGDLVMPESNISTLATQISVCTSKVSSYLSTNGLPFPSFAEDAPPQGLGINDPSVERARLAAMSACTQLLELLQGPSRQLSPIVRRISTQRHESNLSIYD